MATRKRPQLGALFGGEESAPERPAGATRLRAVSDHGSTTDGPADRPRPAESRILPDAGTPAAHAAERATPWSPGGWLDPMVMAAQYFDFWQSVLDSSRRLVLGATATAIGRRRSDED